MSQVLFVRVELDDGDIQEYGPYTPDQAARQARRWEGHDTDLGCGGGVVDVTITDAEGEPL